LSKDYLVASSFHSGSTFEAAAGYARAKKVQNFVFVAGTTGFDYTCMTIADAVSEQTKQSLRNVEAALGHFGLTLSDVVQCNWVITDASWFEEVGSILKATFPVPGPPMMTLVCGLVDPRMKFEMQVIAMAAE
jgi:enamine deaminase RidA (YjgF/YER057c/UK114 family)